MPDGVERMDGHVHEQHMVHLLAEAAKVRGLEELGGDDTNVTQPCGDRLELGQGVEVATGLADHQQLAADFGAGGQGQRLGNSWCSRLFAQHRQAGKHGLNIDGMVRHGHRHIDDGVSTSCGGNLADAGPHHHAREPLVRERLIGGVHVQVNQADQFHVGVGGNRVQPGLPHAAGTDLDQAERARRMNSGKSAQLDIAPWYPRPLWKSSLS